MSNDKYTDDTLVLVLGKIRDAKEQAGTEYKERLATLKKKEEAVANELLKRLHERGATQTKTPHGTAFVGEDLQTSIADEGAFFKFVRTTGDLDFFQRRIKVQHLREYMQAHEGHLPPGVNVFKQATINLRRTAAEKEKGNG
jgi:hypothetical protein